MDAKICDVCNERITESDTLVNFMKASKVDKGDLRLGFTVDAKDERATYPHTFQAWRPADTHSKCRLSLLSTFTLSLCGEDAPGEAPLPRVAIREVIKRLTRLSDPSDGSYQTLSTEVSKELQVLQRALDSEFIYAPEEKPLPRVAIREVIKRLTRLNDPEKVTGYPRDIHLRTEVRKEIQVLQAALDAWPELGTVPCKEAHLSRANREVIKNAALNLDAALQGPRESMPRAEPIGLILRVIDVLRRNSECIGDDSFANELETAYIQPWQRDIDLLEAAKGALMEMYIFNTESSTGQEVIDELKAAIAQAQEGSERE